MFTKEQYELAKEGVADPDPEITQAMRDGWKKGIAEYEASQQEPVAAPSTETPAAASAAPEAPEPAAPDASAQLAAILGKDYGPPAPEAPEAPEPSYIEPGPPPHPRLELRSSPAGRR